MTITNFIDHHYRHFNAAALKDGAVGYKKHIDEGGQMLVTLAGAMSSAELGLSLAEMIRQGKVHAISCTGANLEEDVYNLVAHDHYVRIPNYRDLTPEDEQKLLEKHLNRVTDTCIPEEEAIRRIEKAILKVWKDAEAKGESYFPHEFMYKILLSGELKQYYQIDPKNSWLLAAAEKNGFLHAPDTYMDKIAVGPAAKGVIDIDQTPTENIHRVSEALKKSVGDLTVVILDRPRHADLISEVRKTGARIHLIGDGDVSAAVAAGWADSGIDMLMGIGGAPEGVISAAAMRCLGGDFQGKLKFRNEKEKERALKMGIKDLYKKMTLTDLASGNVIFCATGITDGPLLSGVKLLPGGRAKTQSIVMRSQTGTIRNIEAYHNFSIKKGSL